MEGRCGVTMPALRNVRPQWLSDGKINFIVQTGLTPDPDPLLKNTPMLLGYARKKYRAADAGAHVCQWRDSNSGLGPARGTASASQCIARGVQGDALKTRKLLDEARKQRMDIKYVSGEDVEALIAKVYSTPRPVVEATIAATEGPK